MNLISTGIGWILAGATFLPSLFYTNIAILVLSFFLRVENKYFHWITWWLVVVAISIFLNTFLFHYDGYWKHLVLYLFIVFPVVIAAFTNISTDVRLIEAFILCHVYLSVFEFPLQLIQFVGYYGLNFSELMVNSSAGDIGKGTIGNSALLAYKQIISIFMVLMFPTLFKKNKFAILAVLVVSFLFIGANHSVMLFFLAVVLALFFNKPSIKTLIIFLCLIVISILLMNYIFHSQVQYIISTLSRFELDSFPRYLMLSDWFKYSNINEILQTFFVGNGVGVLGSRTSFILSGQYLWGGEMPLLGVGMIELFRSVMLPLWNTDVTSNLYVSGTYYMPFSTYSSVFLEYGLFGLFLLSYFLIKCVLLLRKALGFIGVVFGLFIVVMMAIDNFIEYPRFILPVLLTIFYTSRLECQK